ncbi:hypothetical protein AM1_5097 [Acaryochloris marina MBIC11017]|uniref:Uncharacterized protein n=1 Tax=Acaryochloris marina (strain MBIC 11017) TaxID=329726 RepID=B0C784_ACAM1|nr:hypothetical protein AM1_5097 [Acaryochloris marina MBIC11017]
MPRITNLCSFLEAFADQLKGFEPVQNQLSLFQASLSSIAKAH